MAWDLACVFYPGSPFMGVFFHSVFPYFRGCCVSEFAGSPGVARPFKKKSWRRLLPGIFGGMSSCLPISSGDGAAIWVMLLIHPLFLRIKKRQLVGLV